MRVMKRWAIVLVAGAVVVAGAACGSGDSSETTEESGWGHDLSTLIEDAEEAGATAEQIAILEEAQETGEISFEVYSEAVDRALRCVRETGGRATDRGIEERDGIRVRTYSVGAESEEANPAELWGMSNHRCIVEHSFAIEIAYQGQPSSVEAQEASWEERREAIVVCLHEEGFDDVVGDEPMSDLRRIAGEAVLEGETGQDCLNVDTTGGGGE